MALRLEALGSTTGCAKYVDTAKRARDGRPVFTGKITLDYDAIDLPMRWKKPKRVFVNSMSDLFHDKVPIQFIQRVFSTMKACPQHDFQILTKRPERTLAVSSELDWSDNVWMGTSVESALYTHRVETLRCVPAKIRFLSCEPLLGPIPKLPLDGIHWVIVGGESGPGARPMEQKWVEQIRDWCTEKEVAFFFKQWGGVQKCKTGRILEHRTWDEMPMEAKHRGTNRLARAL